MDRENLLQKVQSNGTVWRTSLEKLCVDFPQQVKAISGRGYMIGLVLQSEPPPFVAALRDEGLLTVQAGGNTIRLLPPLIATPEQLDRATSIIRSVLVRKNQSSTS
jgi:acetylornithine aminotransferase/acetylornithine/N-succinyldiaminopimelate aminotransferase